MWCIALVFVGLIGWLELLDKPTFTNLVTAIISAGIAWTVKPGINGKGNGHP